MDYLTDENPYAILGLTSSADRIAIKNAFARKSSERLTGEQRRRVHQAYEVLRSTDERALVDALNPALDAAEPPQAWLSELARLITTRPGLIDQIDREAVWQADYRTLVKATIQCLCQPDSESGGNVSIAPGYDGLAQFVEEFGR